MSSSEKIVESLSEFGLTRNQARVYMAIARLKLASVGEISKVAKVRREDVYRILPKLEELGLIEKLLGMPAKIRATPVEEALSLLIKNQEETAKERLSAMKAKTATFLKNFASAPRVEEEEADFTLLSKRESVMAKMLTMLKNAEREVDIVCSERKIMQLLHYFTEELKRITKKGVGIRIISEVREYEDQIPRIIEERLSPGTSINLKYTELNSSHYTIVDFKQALIATNTEGNLGEKPCLFTTGHTLVGVFQENFENLWHNSVSWKNIEKNAVPEKVAHLMEKLSPTNHLIFFYDTPEAKYNVLFNYLKVGLDNGEAAVYVASDEKPSQIREAMKRFGINVEEYEKTGAICILGYEDIYIMNGKFSASTTINLWNELYWKALKNGFKGLRVTGETGCFFKHNLIQELLEYEKALHRNLDMPIIAICAYNASMLNKSGDPVNLYSELARAHGTVLFTGIDNKLGRMEIREPNIL